MKDIKIALYGQFDNDTKYAFTFPDDFNPAMTMTAREEWMRTISDPRDDARVFNTDRIYAVWRNSEGGNYYGVIVPNRKDTRNGYILLALFVDRQLPRSGTVALEALKQLERMLIDEQVRDKQLVAQYVDSIRQLFADDTSMLPAAQKTLTRAYRLYGSEQELAELMSYPHQDAYAPFNRVLFVPQHAAPQTAIANFQQLSNAIRRSYAVSCPDGVSANRSSVMDGESFIVSYSKGGYPPHPFEVTVKGPSGQFYTIENGVLRVKSAEAAGVVFRRRARFRAFSAATNQPLSSFVVDGTRLQDGQEANIRDQEELTFRVEAAGYLPQTLKVRLGDLMRNNFLVQATLEPKEESVRIAATVDGHPLSGTARMAADDPLLSYLRSGKYTVSLSSKKGGSSLPSKAGSTAAQKKGEAGKPWLKTLLVALGALVVGFLLGALLTGGGDTADDDVDEATVGRVTGLPGAPTQQLQQQEEEPADEPSEEELQFQKEESVREAADLQYMKQQDTWTAAELQSVKYIDLFDAIKRADIEAIMAHDYSTNDQLNRNGYWVKAADAIKRIQQSGDQARLSQCKLELQRLTRDGRCNLGELASAMMSIARPAAAPATTTPTPPAATPRTGSGNRGSAQGGGNAGNSGHAAGNSGGQSLPFDSGD